MLTYQVSSTHCNPLHVICRWYVEAEKQNGRWAMLGVAGILGQELLGVQPKWFEAGAKDYGIPPITLIGLEAFLFGFIELKRLQGYKKTGGVGGLLLLLLCYMLVCVCMCVCVCVCHPPPPALLHATYF
jgi:hypothetical protein